MLCFSGPQGQEIDHVDASEQIDVDAGKRERQVLQFEDAGCLQGLAQAVIARHMDCDPPEAQQRGRRAGGSQRSDCGRNIGLKPGWFMSRPRCLFVTI